MTSVLENPAEVMQSNRELEHLLEHASINPEYLLSAGFQLARTMQRFRENLVDGHIFSIYTNYRRQRFALSQDVLDRGLTVPHDGVDFTSLDTIRSYAKDAFEVLPGKQYGKHAELDLKSKSSWHYPDQLKWFKHLAYRFTEMAGDYSQIIYKPESKTAIWNSPYRHVSGSDLPGETYASSVTHSTSSIDSGLGTKASTSLKRRLDDREDRKLRCEELHEFLEHPMTERVTPYALNQDAYLN
ncbi:MAG: hypothetical protein ACLFTH_04920 [Candidatus Woesearchaeota archaeon]